MGGHQVPGVQNDLQVEVRLKSFHFSHCTIHARGIMVFCFYRDWEISDRFSFFEGNMTISH